MILGNLAATKRTRGPVGLAGLALFLLAGPVRAGTTGSIAGRVTDSGGGPVVAVTVRVVDTPFGAYSDSEGSFAILNVPAGTYEVGFSRLGFAPRLVREVIVSADKATRLDVALGEADVQVEEVVVTAERPPVELRRTSSSATLTTQDIEELPVQELQDIVNLQAGVVDGHFRGGRTGEVQYQVDGVSVNNAYDNKSSLKIDRSLLQEVQVISGTFDAEYGQAMSGVVNAVLKQGTPELEWSAEAYTGGFAFGGERARLVDDTVRPFGTQNYQATLRGPLPVRDTFFLVSGRRATFDDYPYGERRFLPTDDVPAGTADFSPSGDSTSVPLGWRREWSGAAKLTTTAISRAKISYQVLANTRKERPTRWAFRYNPDGVSTQRELSVTHGLDLTWTLSGTTYWDLNLRQNYLRYTDWVYEDVNDPRYDAAGIPVTDDRYEAGAVIQGVEFTRFKQVTDNYVVKTALVSQVTAEHQVKAGGELSLPRISFGTPGWLVYTQEGSENVLRRYVDRPPDYPGIREYRPVSGAAFLQDQMEWPQLVIRAGLRVDYFDAQSTVPTDPANPADAIAGAPPSPPRATSRKVYVSPRLGVSYPIEDYAAVHFAYGHFRQFPAISDMFSNADYAKLATIQAGVDPGVFGNPDLDAEQTVQYEIGYSQNVNADLGFDLTVFYKDIRDLLGVEFISTYNDAEYARLTNVDFGDVLGITVSVDDRRLGPVGVALDYSWQRATGNSSDPRETHARAEAGEDARPRLVPFDWDQQHTLNATISYNIADTSISTVVRVASGQPYTPILDAGFGNGLEENAGRKPASAVVDLRMERGFRVAGRPIRFFARAFNLFDTRFANGTVFSSTGSADYSRFPRTDEARLEDPTRFYVPRRIELGIRLDSEGW